MNQVWMDGLKDRPRSGSRPPEVSEEKFAEIRRELSENLAGWRAKEVMNIIYEKTGVRYHHEVHVYRLLHKWKFSPKVQRKRFVNAASNEEMKQFKKLILFLDRAAQHRRLIMFRKHLEENKDVIRVEYLPKGSPGNNAIEEC